ncbi:MAG: ClpXP protease specificity-enhancing factor [Gammaproteobacteria bacterium]|nr:ClpXP protease specificity-enhancing factor [Gammaproteobacteria bacterium]
MTSNKPYIIRALFEWIVDNSTTPYLLVDAFIEYVMVPDGIENDGKIILNINPSAVRSLEMTNEGISFSARFNGQSENIFIPINAVLAIYAQENGEGMMFPPETLETASDTAESRSDTANKPQDKPKKPALSIVK